MWHPNQRDSKNVGLKKVILRTISDLRSHNSYKWQKEISRYDCIPSIFVQEQQQH